MIRRRTFVLNLTEVLVLSVILFVVYRIIIKSLGTESLGLYAVVVSVTSMAKLADLGVAGGISRYIAQNRDAGEAGQDSIRDYIQTSLSVILLTLSAILLVGYYPATFAFRAALPTADHAEAMAILPLAALSFILMNINGIASAGLIGFNRSDLKSFFSMAGAVAFLVIAVGFAKQYGLAAIMIGQCAQYLLSLMFGWIWLKRHARLSWMPFRINRAMLPDILNFGVKLQALTIAAMLFDPIAKLSLSHLSGLSNVGMYEAYSRIILQLRSLFTAVTQNYIALLAHAMDDRQGRLRETFDYSCVLSGYTGLAFFIGCVVGTPILLVLVGTPWHQIDAGVLILLSAAWTFNILAIPHYWLGIAGNLLRWNILSALVMGGTVPLIALTWDSHVTLRDFAMAIMLSQLFSSLVLILPLPPLFGLSRYASVGAFRAAAAKMLANPLAALRSRG